MALLINLRHLEKDDLVLKGEIPASELDLDGVDELIRLEKPLKYDLQAQKLEKTPNYSFLFKKIIFFPSLALFNINCTYKFLLISNSISIPNY